MKKKILFIGYNFSPELTGIGKYSGEMMEWLAAYGHECTVFTAYPYYPQWQVQEPYRKNRFWFTNERKTYPSGGSLTIKRCPMYVPKNPTGAKRIVLDTSFSISALLVLLPSLFTKKRDWVISVAPSFQFGLLGVFYKKVKGAKHLHHIQDLQIEAAQDLGMVKSKKLLELLFKMESYIFKNTDIISSISEGMMQRIEQKADKKVLFFPNWVETSFFYPLENPAGLKEKFGFDSSDWVVLYSGAIGEKQGLEAILDAAYALKEYNSIKFVICGTGPYKAVLEAKAEELELKNVQFMPLQPKQDFNAFLNMADLHLVIQKEKASDLVMPSKLTTILAVGGVALITANPSATLHQVVKKYEMGILVPAEDQLALNQGILDAYTQRADDRMALAARRYAEQFLSLENVMEKFNQQSIISG